MNPKSNFDISDKVLFFLVRCFWRIYWDTITFTNKGVFKKMVNENHVWFLRNQSDVFRIGENRYDVRNSYTRSPADHVTCLSHGRPLTAEAVPRRANSRHGQQDAIRHCGAVVISYYEIRHRSALFSSVVVPVSWWKQQWTHPTT